MTLFKHSTLELTELKMKAIVGTVQMFMKTNNTNQNLYIQKLICKEKRKIFTDER